MQPPDLESTSGGTNAGNTHVMVVIDSVILSPEEISDDHIVIALIDPKLVPTRGLDSSVMLNYFIHLVASFVTESGEGGTSQPPPSHTTEHTDHVPRRFG